MKLLQLELLFALQFGLGFCVPLAHNSTQVDDLPRSQGKVNVSRVAEQRDYSFLSSQPKTDGELKVAVAEISNATLSGLFDPASSLLTEAIHSDDPNAMPDLLNAVFANDLAKMYKTRINATKPTFTTPTLNWTYPPDPVVFRGEHGFERYVEIFGAYGLLESKIAPLDGWRTVVEVITDLLARRTAKGVPPEALYPEDEYFFSTPAQYTRAQIVWKFTELDVCSYRDISAAAAIFGKWFRAWGDEEALSVPSARAILKVDSDAPDAEQETLGIVRFDVARLVDSRLQLPPSRPEDTPGVIDARAKLM